MCNVLGAPSNGRLTLSRGNLVGSVATYTCNPGFQRNGDRTRVCQRNGEWTGTAPVCTGEPTILLISTSNLLFSSLPPHFLLS